MKKGVKILEDVPGEGAVAPKKAKGTARISTFLGRGDCVDKDRIVAFSLHNRDLIAGVRYAIEGMRVGGRRKIKVSPHLAYRDVGVGDLVPPNAIVIVEIELLSLD